MDNCCLNGRALGGSAERVCGVRRIFSGTERRFLSHEALSMAYGLLDSQSVSPYVTENAVQQAVTLGSLSGETVDAETFEVLFNAILLNPSYKIPIFFTSDTAPSGTWVS